MKYFHIVKINSQFNTNTMENNKTSGKSDGTKNSMADNHKMAATHNQEAAKCYHDAAKHHEDGTSEKAFEYTLKAQGHHCCAGKHQKAILKEHATN